mgnify:CR=1 FL=1
MDNVVGKNIIVKNFPKTNKLENCLRVSIGLPKENKRFMSVVSSFLVKYSKKTEEDDIVE